MIQYFSRSSGIYPCCSGYLKRVKGHLTLKICSSYTQNFFSSNLLPQYNELQEEEIWRKFRTDSLASQ